MELQFPIDNGFVQSVGIDISKGTFTACICMSDLKGHRQHSEVREYKNDRTGFNQLVKWTRKHLLQGYPCRYVMEVSGTYHEKLAYHLWKLHFDVVVVVPSRSRKFAEYNAYRTKTDKADSMMLSEMGCCDTRLNSWEPPEPVYKRLKQLERMLWDLKKHRTRMNNNLEAITHSASPTSEVVKEYRRLVGGIEKSIKRTEKQIEDVLKNDDTIRNDVRRLMTIPAVGLVSAVTVLAETQGFHMITSRKQLASFAGLDAEAHESGAEKPRRKISKRGNTRIRGALYMPALVAKVKNPDLKKDYDNILQRNLSRKKVAVLAIERKLLLLMYTLWKKGEDYVPQ